VQEPLRDLARLLSLWRMVVSFFLLSGVLDRDEYTLARP
jgi:hypothetical protein